MRAWLVVVTACASAPAKQEETIALVPAPSCVAYSYYRLKYTSFPSESGEHAAFYAADHAAREHVAAAESAADAKHYGAAARAFLACAVDYRGVPDDDRGLPTALENARFCYQNALAAFANAGEAATGRALVEQAARDDARQGEFLRDQLAHAPGDCKVE